METALHGLAFCIDFFYVLPRPARLRLLCRRKSSFCPEGLCALVFIVELLLFFDAGQGSDRSVWVDKAGGHLFDCETGMCN